MLFQSGLYLSFDKWCEAERCFTYYFAITLSFCTPPLRPPSLPCWGSFAGRRPGTRFAGTRAPIWTGCDASSCWWAQSRRHRTAQAPGSVDWTLERETAADPDCFCLSNFQNSGLFGWILKRERSRFDRVCSLHSADQTDRQTDRSMDKNTFMSLPWAFGSAVNYRWEYRGGGRLTPGPSLPISVGSTKTNPFPFFGGAQTWLAIVLRKIYYYYYFIGSLALRHEATLWILKSCVLMSRRWVPPSLRSRGKNVKRYSLHLDKMFRGWK